MKRHHVEANTMLRATFHQNRIPQRGNRQSASIRRDGSEVAY